MTLGKSLYGMAGLVIALTTPQTSRPPGPDPAASARIRELEGVYKVQQTLGYIDAATGRPADRPEVVEDTVEIVRYDATHIYFRAELKFYNAHTCGIYGIAGYQSGSFIYQRSDTPLAGEPSCRMAISTTKTHLVLTDRAESDGVATCRNYCGARGNLSDYKIELSRKRPIRYMSLLKDSREYATAVSEWVSGKVRQ